MVADDQVLNLQAIKLALDEFDVKHKVSYLGDGQQAYDKVMEIAHEAVANAQIFPIKPVSILLLDY